MGTDEGEKMSNSNGNTLCVECHKIEHSIGYAAKRVFKSIASNASLGKVLNAMKGRNSKIYECIKSL